MSDDWTMVRIEEVPDVLGDYPGEMRFLTGPLGAGQVAVTHRRMPAQTGGKGGYGHRHRSQEEVYVVLAGTLQAKLDGTVIDLPAPSAVRVAPGVVRSLWNEGPDDVQVLLVSTWSANPSEDAEMVPDFWPAD